MNAFKSERPRISKPRFASQVDEKIVLLKPVTPYYLPKVREYVRAKPHHMNAPGSSRNSQEESYSSNDMAHNHDLEEARKKAQETNRNSKPSVMPSVRLQNTANGSTPNPKRTNQTSRSLPTSKSSCVTIMVLPKADHSRNSSSFSYSKHFFCSTCHKYVFNANHDACITKLLNEVNLHKVKPHKTKNSNDPVEQKSHTQKPGRQIFSGHRFSPKKTSAVYEKTSPRSCLSYFRLQPAFQSEESMSSKRQLFLTTVEPLPEPERTLNRRLRRRNRRVPYDQRNNPPQHPRIVYPPVLNINYFRHFLDILRNYDPIDDEPMWAADHVVAPTPGSAITIPETANEFAIKDTENEVILLMMFPLSLIGEAKTCLSEITQEVLNAVAGGIFLYKTLNQAYQLLKDKVLLKLDWAKNQKTKTSLKKTIAFADEGSSNSNTDKIMARMDAMTLKMDAQLKELQNHAKKTKPDEDDIPISQEEEAKFMQTFRKTRFYNDYRDRDSNRDNWRSNERSSYNRDNYRSSTDDKPYDLQKQFNDFMKSQQSTNAFNLKTKFDRLADKQSGRPSGSLPSNTQPNPKGHNSKAYQPPQSRNEHVNVVFTRSGKSYNPSVNPNDQQNDSETPINFDSDDEDEESTPQPKTQNPKPVKETPLPKPYKPKIPYPQRLRKEKMEAQYRKFLDMICAVRINMPLIDVLARMPNYRNFLKELVNNKHKIKQIFAAFLSDESSAMIQNKVPSKLGDPKSFRIPCNFNKTFSSNALADLGASINLMPYSLYAKLSLETFKPTKMSVRLADRSFQYPVGLAENMLVEVGKFTFPANFIILEMEEDGKVPLILGRPFLHTTDAVIRVKQKQLNLRVGTERMIFNIDFAMKHSYSNDDTCFSIDEILEEDFDALLDEGSKILHSIEGTLLEDEILAEFDEFIAMTTDENSDSKSNTEDPPFEKITINTDYKIKTSLEEPPTDLELKPLPDNLEYVFLEEPSFLLVIISSQLSKEKKTYICS
ncbi:reverse transcriptase domain-containing protein [Tanacetum coccineum]